MTIKFYKKDYLWTYTCQDKEFVCPNQEFFNCLSKTLKKEVIYIKFGQRMTVCYDLFFWLDGCRNIHMSEGMNYLCRLLKISNKFEGHTPYQFDSYNAFVIENIW